MKIDRVSKQYAKGLIQFGVNREDLEKIRKDFRNFLNLIKKLPEMTNFLNDPIISAKEKKNFLHLSFADKIHPKLLKFLSFLVDKGRINKVRSIATAFARMVSEHYGVLEVEVITARELQEEQKNRLKEKLQQHFHIEVDPLEEIDPSIIGGLVLVAGNQMLDDSIKGNLKNLKEKLLSVY